MQRPDPRRDPVDSGVVAAETYRSCEGACNTRHPGKPDLVGFQAEPQLVYGFIDCANGLDAMPVEIVSGFL
jgi:hypothetical protein